MSKTEEAKHTPGQCTLIDEPRNKHYWQSVPYSYERRMQHCRYLAGPDGDSHFVADIITEQSPEGDANAARLARCWNAHDALVKVVAQYLKLFGVYSDPKADKLHARARDVLALAKEGTEQ